MMLYKKIPYVNTVQSEPMQKELATISNLYYSGSYGALVSTKSWYYKKATYVTGTESSATNNSPIILKYNHETQILENVKVGTIDNYDSLEHSHPAIIIKNGAIYIYQVNGHGTDIKIWKSNVNESIADGFTLHHTIPGNFGYCNPRLLNDGSVVLVSRLTSSGSTVYSQVIAKSQPNDYTSWTVKQVTEADHAATGIRHYPSFPNIYGNNTWFYGGISLRHKDTPTGGDEDYFGQAIWKTQDFTTFYSLDGNWSKNIDVNGVITGSEIEANLMVAGTNSAPNKYIMPLQFIVVNDTIYSRYFEEADGYFRWMKIDPSGTINTYPIGIPNIDTTNNFSYKMNMNYNGNNLVILTNGKIYGLDLNFGNQTFFDQYKYDGETEPLDVAVLPYNFPDINEEYMIAGSTDSGNFPYILTSNKFFT
jgi:hypothetical protein